MGQMIPDAFIEELLHKADIAQIIGEYIPLKRAGKNYKANCPFHNERTPSFIVTPDKQIFHCFGCKAGGDVIAFVMKYERLTFPEAVELIARRYGLTVPSSAAQAGPSAASSLTATLLQIHAVTDMFYQQILHQAPEAKHARAYIEKRGISQKSVEQLHIGFSPYGWTHLLEYCKKQKGISEELLIQAGLIIKTDRGTCYDRFRGRLMFPIFDSKGRVIGFGGRTLTDEQPKYLNSPQTSLFSKGRHLYGIHCAKDAIVRQKQVLVVEGYMDFLSVYQSGIEHIVASLGTALTKEQLELLKRYTQHIVMIYDGDTAGQLATLRNLDLAVEEGFAVRVVELPANTDPDSFIRKEGVARFGQLVDQAQGLFQYKLRYLLRCYNKEDIEQKAFIIQEMLETIKKIPNAVVQSEYNKQLAYQLGIDEASLLVEMQKKTLALSRDQKGRQEELKKRTTVSGQGISAEELVAGCMLSSVARVKQVRNMLKADDFQDPEIKQIVKALFSLVDQGREEIVPRDIVRYYESEDIGSRVAALTAEMDMVVDMEKTLHDCIHKIHIQRVKTKMDLLQQQMKEQKNSDPAVIDVSMQQYHLLLQEYRGLQNKKS